MGDTEATSSDGPSLLDLLPVPGLDAAQLEVWASGVMASVDDVDALIGWLADDAPNERAMLLVAAIAAVADDPTRDLARSVAARGPAPPASLGTAEMTRAVLVEADGAQVIATQWRHADGAGHCMLIELELEPDTENRWAIVSVRFGASELLDDLALDAEFDTMTSRELGVGEATRLIEEAATTPIVADDDTWANASAARSRLRAMGVDADLTFVSPPECHPGVEADASSARHVLEVIRSALGIAVESSADSPIVEQAAARVRPLVVRDCGTDEAAAIVQLEWADWLGAVIGLVRAGAGSSALPTDLVAHVNRCPEVTTTIPRSDADHVAHCFSVATSPWAETGLVDDQRLTERGQHLLPSVVLFAARREIEAEHHAPAEC